MPWITQGEQTNPPSGTILADTGPRLEGSFSANVLVGGDNVAGVFRIERRNAANDATLESILVAVAARDSRQFMVGDVQLQDQERVRIVTASLMVGTVQGTFIS